MTLLQHHALALWLTTLTTAALGLLVFLAEPRRRLNQIFGVYSLSIAWWALFEGLACSAADKASATFFAYLEWPGVMFIAPTFFHTVCLLTENTKNVARIILRVAYVLTVVLVLVHILSNQVVAELRPVAYLPFFTRLTPLGLLVPVIFLILVNLALLKLYQAFRASVGLQRTRLRYLLAASVVGYLGGSADWLPVLGCYIPHLNPFGIYCVPLYSLATAYAIFQHRLLDVNVVIKKSVVYSLVVSLLTTGYFGAVYFLERAFQGVLRYDSPWISLAAFASMALLFQPLKMLVQRMVDFLLFRAPQHTMARRLEIYEAKALEGDRYKAAATFAAGIAHELKNPLTSIKTFLSFLPERHYDHAFREQFQETIGSAVERLEQISKSLLDFSMPRALSMQSVDIKAVLDSVLVLISHDFQLKSLRVEVMYSHNGEVVCGDPLKLQQAFLNLLLNAKDAMAAGGALTIFTGAVNGCLEIHIADTGCGIHPKDIPRLFEPFFSKKADGHGLGLSIVQSILREHRGTASVTSIPGRGTTVTVRLPIA